jgi:3-oxoacyl-[acyl-carrier protein] reductase
MQEQADKRVALVTGASRGIGASIADALAGAGHLVIGTATSEAGAAAISERLGDLGGEGRVLRVEDAHSVADTLAEIGDAHGAPTILVNNAGITRDNLLMRMKDEEWQEVIDTNLSAVFRLSKAVLRGMTRARWGRIVTITSVVGSMGNAGQSNYAASKAGAAGFSRALAREIGARNVTVNCVAPGFIDTDMTRALSEEQRAAMLAQIPLARLGDGAEVGALVAFLCSDAAAYITGETIHINGGMYML